MTDNHVPVRHIRMGDLWDRSGEIAAEHGVTRSDLIRVAVERLLISKSLPTILEGAKTREPRGASTPPPPVPARRPRRGRGVGSTD
jgi:hypothetical protein